MSVFRTRAKRTFAALSLLAAAFASAPAESGSVQSAPLSRSIDPAAAGALDPSAARLPANLWRGSDRAAVVGLIDALPARPSSYVLRDLTRRTIACAAPPPPGATVVPGFAQTRAIALLAMGDAPLAASLLSAIPKTARDEATDRLLLDASLLAQDRSLACTVARDRAGLAEAVVFAKASAFCESLAGDRVRAEFAAALAAERAPDDQAFFQLLDLATGAATEPGRAVKRLKSATPLHLAMLRAVGLPPPGLPKELDAPYALAVERMVAVDPAAALDLRAAAAWRALKANAADLGAARQLLLAVGASDSRQTGPAISLAERMAAAAAAAPGPDRALALARLLAKGDELEAGGAVARLATPMTAALLPLASGPDIGGRLARGLLLGGEADRAKRWRDSLERAGAVPGATDEAARLTELIALADGEDSRSFAGVDAALWLGVVSRIYASDQNATGDFAGKVALLSELRAALGLPTAPSQTLAPNAGRLEPLEAAAATGRVGETVLRAAILAESADAALGSRPHRLARATRALAQAGLHAEARQLAVEAAIAGGL